MRSKSGAIIKLVVWLTVAVILIAVLVGLLVSKELGIWNFGGLSFGVGYFYDDAEHYNVGDREYDSDLITDIDISWLAGNVKVVVWENDGFKITESRAGDNEKDQMRSRVIGNTLTVKFKYSGFRAVNSTLSKDLTVYIPSSYAESMNLLSIDAASAGINIDDSERRRLFFNTLDIDTASGEVIVNCKGISYVDVDTASGDIFLTGDFADVNVDAASANVSINGSVDKIDVDSASGKVNIDGEVGIAEISAVSGKVSIKTYGSLPSRIEVDSTSGSIELSLPDIESGFQAKHDSVSGKMICDGVKGDYYRYGEGLADYDFESVSGNVKITVRKD